MCVRMLISIKATSMIQSVYISDVKRFMARDHYTVSPVYNCGLRHYDIVMKTGTCHDI